MKYNHVVTPNKTTFFDRSEGGSSLPYSMRNRRPKPRKMVRMGSSAPDMEQYEDDSNKSQTEDLVLYPGGNL